MPTIKQEHNNERVCFKDQVRNMEAWQSSSSRPLNEPGSE